MQRPVRGGSDRYAFSLRQFEMETQGTPGVVENEDADVNAQLITPGANGLFVFLPMVQRS